MTRIIPFSSIIAMLLVTTCVPFSGSTQWAPPPAVSAPATVQPDTPTVSVPSKPTAAPTSVASPEPAAPPVPTPQLITADNAGRLSVFAHWETSEPAALAWSPDGKTLATAVNDWSLHPQGGVSLFELPSLGLRWSVGLRVGDILFLNRGDQLIVSDLFHETLTFMDGATGVLSRQLADPACGSHAPSHLRLSGDDSMLAVANSASGLNAANIWVHLWDLTAGVCRGLFVRHGGELTTVDLSSDGQALLIGIFNAGPPYLAQVHLWDVPTRQLTCWFRSTAATLNPEGDVVAVVNHETQLLQFYDAQDCRLLLSSEPDFPTLSRNYRLAYSFDGRLLAVGQESLRVMDTSTGELLRDLGTEDVLEDVAFSPDGLYLASSSCYPCSVTLWAVVHDQ